MTEPTNLQTRGRLRRLVSGVFGVAAGIGLTVWLYPRDITWFAGFATLPFFLLGMLGVLQAYSST